MMKRRSQLRRSSLPKPGTQRTTRPAAAIKRPRRTRAEKAAAQHLLAVLKAGGDARVTKIKRVRQSVRASSYENELKLSIAIERMVKELSV